MRTLQGNQDGQPQTNFGALDAYEVPWIVIPNRFAAVYQDVIPGNNVAAIIWYLLVLLFGDRLKLMDIL